MVKAQYINTRSEYVLQDIITGKFKTESGNTDNIAQAQVFSGKTLVNFTSWKYLNWKPLEFVNKVL